MMTALLQSKTAESLAPAVPTAPIYRLSVAQYHAMIQAGILTEDDPIELLEGWLVAKMPKNRGHTIANENTRRGLESILPAGWYVSAQEPITLMDSEPEPDVMVVRGELTSYPDRHPGPADVALVVEVSDSTLQRDRTLKKAIYARAGITVYWIVNLIEAIVEVYTDPTGNVPAPDYQNRQDFKPGDTLPLLIEGHEIGHIPVAQFLPS